MDYEKIYKDFIKSRRTKEKKFTGYFENHHIIPKALGGSDDKKNLIKLTPEDHFFAHLLLAKIHGGKMVFALCAMSNLPAGEFRPDFSKRMKYGWVRRMLAKNYSENYSGIKSPHSDKKTYVFGHYDGRIALGNRFEIMKQTGLSNRAVSFLVLGQKKSYNGWCYLLKNPLLTRKELHRKNNPNVCRKVYKLYHFDGRKWEGTKCEFFDMSGGKLHFQNNDGHCQGWYKEKKNAENHFIKLKEKCKKNSQKRGNISGLNNPRADQTIYHFINVETLEEKFCTRYEMSVFLNLKPTRLSDLFSGKQRKIRNWSLHERRQKRDK